VFVGMRLPLLGFGLAKATHAPDAVGLFENGVIRDRPAETFIYTMGDPPNIVGAVACLGLMDLMSLLQQGRVDVGFIGGAEVDPLRNPDTARANSRRAPIRPQRQSPLPMSSPISATPIRKDSGPAIA